MNQNEMIEMIEDLVSQSCMITESDGREILDSMAITTYARAIKFLAELGKVKIIDESGRRVLAEHIIPYKEEGQ